MKLLMISGSYPPVICGVGDYTAQLITALRNRGASVITLEGMRWDWQSLRKGLEVAARESCDVIHIQYPAVGYGYSLMPQLLSFRLPSVVTLHEFSNVRILRKAASFPFLVSARRLVFTSRDELEYVRRFYPLIARKSSVIPIGTNITPIEIDEPREFGEIVYFGMIAPRKGLEKVLDFAQALKQDGCGLSVRLIGSVPEAFQAYAASLMEKAEHLPISWTRDASESEVAQHLARASLAYLPFPDGASERRGSLKAVLSCGLVCISTAGRHTPPKLRELLFCASNSREAVAIVKALMHDHSAWRQASERGLAYAESFRWDHIAQAHLDLYANMLSKTR